MKTPNQNTTPPLEESADQTWYHDDGQNRLTRFRIITFKGDPDQRGIIIDVVDPTSLARVPGTDQYRLPMTMDFGLDYELRETPMCDPATGAQSFTMVLRSQVYPARKTSGPIA